MKEQKRELNHLINMMYRQLGKDLYDDLKKDQVNIRKYRNLSRKIDNVIHAMESLEEPGDAPMDDDMKVLKKPEMGEDGLYQYLFCPHCNAGNSPEATHCIRCHEPLNL